MTKVITQTYTLTMEYRAKISATLLIGCAALAIFYAFNVYRVIAATVALQKTDMQTASLSSAVDQLDTQYLQVSDALTPDLLAQYGLSEGQVSEYIDRNASLGVALSEPGF